MCFGKTKMILFAQIPTEQQVKSLEIVCTMLIKLLMTGLQD